MNLFETVFPQFIVSCAKLHNALAPWSLAILVLAFPFEFARGVDVRRLLIFLAKIFIIILLTAQAHNLINTGQLVVDQFLDQTGLVRPEKVAEVYKERVAAALGEPDLQNKSVLGMMLSGHFLDALIYGFLLGVSYLVLAILMFITFVQQAALLLCWSITPVMFSLLAVEPVAHLGAAHVKRLLAILAWPLGFCIAGTLSDALINMALADRVLAGDSKALSLAAAIESLLVLAVVGVFDVVSTIMAPALAHRFLVGHAGPATAIPQSLHATASVVLPALAGSAQRVVEFVRSHVGGSGGKSGSDDPANPGAQASRSSPPPPPPPPMDPPPSRPQGSSFRDDPTGVRELERLLNQQ